MMNGIKTALRTSDMRRLARVEANVSLSIYVPLNGSGNDNRQDSIRLKNTLRETEAALADRRIPAPHAEAMTDALRRLVAEPSCWQGGRGTLACFLTETVVQPYRLPVSLEPLVEVGRRFRIVPLLPVVLSTEPFYLLALSRKQVHLWFVDDRETREVEVQGLPAGMDEALNYDDADPGFQVHSAMRGDLGKEAAVFHGQGGEPDANKEELRAYLRLVEHAITRHLREDQTPLVVAAVDYVAAMYREINTYRRLLAESVVGNPDHRQLAELIERARPIVDRRQGEARDAALRRYLDLRRTDRAAEDVRQIVPAAARGQVDLLLVDPEATAWGQFDADAARVHVHRQPDAADEELINLAVCQTLAHGGTVWPVPQRDPATPPIAALLRYPVATPTA